MKTEDILEMEKKMCKQSGSTGASTDHRIQETEERISGIEDMIEVIVSSVK